mmetsp:Transcript_47939/g.154665  ORF Transcript_47939/g.154665 Transcript_47939/m.154665 type:complete len:211 (-) Transcript_47939:450-1082(-)
MDKVASLWAHSSSDAPAFCEARPWRPCRAGRRPSAPGRSRDCSGIGPSLSASRKGPLAPGAGPPLPPRTSAAPADLLRHREPGRFLGLGPCSARSRTPPRRSPRGGTPSGRMTISRHHGLHRDNSHPAHGDRRGCFMGPLIPLTNSNLRRLLPRRRCRSAHRTPRCRRRGRRRAPCLPASDHQPHPPPGRLSLCRRRCESNLWWYLCALW